LPDHAEQSRTAAEPGQARTARAAAGADRRAEAKLAEPTRLLQRRAKVAAADAPVPIREPGPRPNRTGLPDLLKAGVEALSGLSMDDVRVHRNSGKPAQLQAHAFAQGSDIHLAPGQEQHLPHEAWHMVQQKQGRVRATTQLNGVAIDVDAGLEAEADRMGMAAARDERRCTTIPSATGALAPTVIQRAAHRPNLGSQVIYNGLTYNVIQSAAGNPQIQLRLAAHPQTTLAPINWAAAAYTIIRPNNAQDHDLRVNNPGQGVDRYAALSYFERIADIRARFATARAQALAMIKAHAAPQVAAAALPSLNALTLGDFVVTQESPTIIGAGTTREPSEWQVRWVEGDVDNPRRVWTLVIDSDDPLPDSIQEPHVGWTASAAAGAAAAVPNTFGHVWVDHVPVSRQ
jgi:hypothetical protein